MSGMSLIYQRFCSTNLTIQKWIDKISVWFLRFRILRYDRSFPCFQRLILSRISNPGEKYVGAGREEDEQKAVLADSLSELAWPWCFPAPQSVLKIGEYYLIINIKISK